MAVLAAVTLFSAAPGLDLAVSGLFHADGAFPLAGLPQLEVLRIRIWDLSEIVVAAALAGVVAARATGRAALWLPARAWAFVVALYVVGPGLIVNLGLKSHWGRARPANVTEFGGTQTFTPALQPATECARNCSFVSGEAASAAALGIAMAVALAVLRPRLPDRTWRLGLAAAVAVALVGGLLRVATGRHFLSDVVFAWLITAGVALALRALILRGGWRRLAAGMTARAA
jgi:lipid A 4'-phosphatase